MTMANCWEFSLSEISWSGAWTTSAANWNRLSNMFPMTGRGARNLTPATTRCWKPLLLCPTLAGVRIATSIFFLLFGEYKIAGPGFAHGGFQTYLHDYDQQRR